MERQPVLHRLPVALDGAEVSGIVADEAFEARAKLSQNLHVDAIISLVGFESKAFVGLYGVESFILQAVGTNLVGQANPSSFLVQVKQYSRPSVAIRRKALSS